MSSELNAFQVVLAFTLLTGYTIETRAWTYATPNRRKAL